MFRPMTRGAAIAGALAALTPTGVGQPTAPAWGVHDEARPLPPRVEVAEPASAPIPADALVLFDGVSLDAWRHPDGSAASWTVRDGVLEVRPGAGPIVTRAPFGDVQLHIEFMAPPSESGDAGQDRANSGLFFLERYEIQILESTGSTTYADGMCGSLYGQHPPLVNAGSGIGRWNSYDIVFRAPRFDGARLVRPATITAFHNGVLIHDGVDFEGATRHRQRTRYEAHPHEAPIMLQDHGDPVRFRTIWVRPLSAHRADGHAPDPRAHDHGWRPLFDAGRPGSYEVAGSEGAAALVGVRGNRIEILHAPAPADPPYAYLVTADAFASYDLSFRVRWGARRFPPRLDRPRNSGVLLHVREPLVVWPRSIEFQVQDGFLGDVVAMRGAKARDVRTGAVLNASSDEANERSPRWSDAEGDGWNRGYAQVRGDRAWFWVNGRLVQHVDGLRDGAGPLDSGRIALQVEAAEVTYEDVRIRPLRD